MAGAFLQIGNVLDERLLRIGSLRPRWGHKKNRGEYACANYNSKSIRLDLGLFREELMVWCEDDQVDYVMWLAKTVNVPNV
jgi:hypothetical protein